jgi:REP element-mobilizing transposase RayT
MSHSYARNAVHVVFSSKERRKTLPKEFQPKMYAYHDIFLHAIGGAEEHVHLLIQIPPMLSLAKAVAAIKANSSRWSHQEGKRMVWQEGYAAFSVSESIVPAVVRYIQNQEAHHRKINFEDEFRALLKKHNVKFDPRFVLG